MTLLNARLTPSFVFSGPIPSHHLWCTFRLSCTSLYLSVHIGFFSFHAYSSTLAEIFLQLLCSLDIPPQCSPLKNSEEEFLFSGLSFSPPLLNPITDFFRNHTV